MTVFKQLPYKEEGEYGAYYTDCIQEKAKLITGSGQKVSFEKDP
jgi:hypothetical protein